MEIKMKPINSQVRSVPTSAPSDSITVTGTEIKKGSGQARTMKIPTKGLVKGKS